MEARELRIGNLVMFPLKSNDPDFQEFESDVHHISYDEDTGISFVNDEFDIQDIKPIPLTEEWLVMFGFRLWCGSYELNDIKIFEVETGNFVLEGDSKSIGKIFKYVHQLQNLYFALTGEELTIK